MVLQYIVNGLTMGMVYALVAVGYSLIFGILRLVNMAHGTICALGANIMLAFIVLKWGIIPAIIASLIITCLIVLLFETNVLAPLRKKSTSGISSLISTIGFAYVIQNLMVIIFGSETRRFPALFDFGNIEIAGVQFQSSQIVIFVVSIVLLAGLTLVIKKTKIGLAMRGVEQNSKAAYLMGVDARKVIAFAFILSAISAVVAALLVSSYYQMVYPTMGSLIGLKAFSAAVLGGIGILYGSIIGGLILGISESLAVMLFSGAYRDAVAFIILFLVLIVRPNGLFGKKTISKV